MAGPTLLMGAADRLLPASVPFRFFAAALACHLAAWLVLAEYADLAPGFIGGPGPILAALHLITLGVLAMVAMGAAYQLLPVATSRSLGPVWACRLSWWLFVPGVILLAIGFCRMQPGLMHGGGGMAVAGLAIAAILMARTLGGAATGVALHVWIALVSLAVLATLGLALTVDFTKGFLPDHQAVARVHMVLAAYGFMGNLAMGFSYVLVPMFVLGQDVPERLGKTTALLSAVALAAASAGILAELPWLSVLAGVLGLVAIGLHFAGLVKAVKTRMRKRFEPHFKVLVPAWVMLPLSICLGIALVLGAPIDPLAPIWGLMVILGWLLTFALGMLQRIMPFLASMHSAAGGRQPALLSALTWRRPLNIQAGLHFIALAAVAVGLVFDWPYVIRGGAIAGAIGAVALIVFAVELARRTSAHLRSTPAFE